MWRRKPRFWKIGIAGVFILFICILPRAYVLWRQWTSSTSIPPDVDVVISMSRNGLYYTPVYSVWIRRDGTVVYDGKYRVAVKGMQKMTISRDDVEKLILEFERIDFFSLEDRYENPERMGVASHPEYITISLTAGEQSKSVTFTTTSFGGARLFEIERRIEAIANAKGWIWAD